MFYDLKNFDGSNSDIIEIVSSDSSFGLLKHSSNNNIKVCLPLSLCIGKFESNTPYNREELSKKYNNTFYDLTYEFNKLKELINNCSKIRIWSSHIDTNEYCLFLLICFMFKDKNISVIFSDEFNKESTSISAVSKKDINNLEKIEHILTKSQKEYYSDEWLKIINDNKELRYMDNGNVVSCNIDRFDNEIIDRLKKSGKTNIIRFIADLMGNPIIKDLYYPDWIYMYLINRLINKDIISIDNNYIELK